MRWGSVNVNNMNIMILKINLNLIVYLFLMSKVVDVASIQSFIRKNELEEMLVYHVKVIYILTGLKD